LALKQNQVFSVNVSGPGSENCSEDGSCVSLVLAGSVSNVLFQQRNGSPEEHKEGDGGTGCVVCSWIYLRVCASEMKDRARNRTSY